MSDANAVFETAILAGFPRLPGVFPAIYRPKAGGEVATYAKIETATLETDGRAQGEYARIRIPRRDVPAPVVDDVVEIGGEIWEFRVNQDRKLLRSRSPDNLFWLLGCRLQGSVALTGGHS